MEDGSAQHDDDDDDGGAAIDGKREDENDHVRGAVSRRARGSAILSRPFSDRSRSRTPAAV